MKQIFYFIVATSMLLFGSCSNEELEPSVLTLLTNNGTKSWRVIQIEENGEIDQNDCQRDDIYTFTLFDESTESTHFQIEDNLISCGYSDTYISGEGTWRINNKGNRLTLLIRDIFDTEEEEDISFYNFTMDIVEITESKLVLRQYDEWNEFDPAVYTITFTEF